MLNHERYSLLQSFSGGRYWDDKCYREHKHQRARVHARTQTHACLQAHGHSITHCKNTHLRALYVRKFRNGFARQQRRGWHRAQWCSEQDIYAPLLALRTWGRMAHCLRVSLLVWEAVAVEQWRTRGTIARRSRIVCSLSPQSICQPNIGGGRSGFCSPKMWEHTGRQRLCIVLFMPVDIQVNSISIHTYDIRTLWSLVSMPLPLW